MNRKPDPAGPDAQALSLRRWSQRKLEAQRAEPQAKAEPAAAPFDAAGGTGARRLRIAARTRRCRRSSRSRPIPISPRFSAAGRRSTTHSSAPRSRQLLRDPRFNVMDGLDIYIDDYTREDPIPESVLRRMAHARAVPGTRASRSTPGRRRRKAAICRHPSASPPPAAASATALPVSDLTTAAHDPAPADALPAASLRKP